MTPGEVVIWVLAVLIGLSGSALWSGLETAFYCMSGIRLAVRAESGSRAAQILRRESARPERLLTTLLIGTNSFNYLGSLGIAALLTGAGFSDAAIVVLQALVLTPALLVFAETLPKEVFRIGADVLPYRFAWAVPVFRWCFTIIPVVPMIGLLTRALNRGGAIQSPREHMAALIKEDEATISEVQASMVDRALRFSRATVATEMVPWRSARSLQVEWDRDRILREIEGGPHSRFPVVDRRGRVIGIVSVLDLRRRSGVGLRELVREPARLTPDCPLRDAMIRLGEAPTRIAIVEDQGRPIGLVTHKDLVEPLTGEIGRW